MRPAGGRPGARPARGGWGLALLLWLALALYLAWPAHRLAWRQGTKCLASSLSGRLCARWLAPPAP